MGMQRLTRELAVVTGSDSGIGQATAIAFAKEGADIIVTYFHDRAGADHTAYEIETAGRKAAVFNLDQRDPENVRRLFQEVKTAFGVPTILVDAAGVDASGIAV